MSVLEVSTAFISSRTISSKNDTWIGIILYSSVEYDHVALVWVWLNFVKETWKYNLDIVRLVEAAGCSCVQMPSGNGEETGDTHWSGMAPIGHQANYHMSSRSIVFFGNICHGGSDVGETHWRENWDKDKYVRDSMYFSSLFTSIWGYFFLIKSLTLVSRNKIYPNTDHHQI